MLVWFCWNIISSNIGMRRDFSVSFIHSDDSYVATLSLYWCTVFDCLRFDSLTGVPSAQRTVGFEKGSILFNIGALQTQIAARQVGAGRCISASNTQCWCKLGHLNWHDTCAYFQATLPWCCVSMFTYVSVLVNHWLQICELVVY